MTDRVRLTYRGAPPFRELQVLLRYVRDEGLEVQHEPLMEYRGGGRRAAAVLVAVWVTANVAEPLGADELRTAVRRAVGRFRIAVEDRPPERRPTVQCDGGDGY